MFSKLSAFCLFTFALLLVLGANAQNFSVREIMAEPSIAGMRPEAEKLSPDGKYVVFLWNAEGKEPKDLYVVSTRGGEPRKLLSPKDLLSSMPAPQAESKLNYGLIVNDDFAKARQNQIGNLEWSPDSRKILFAQNGDLYILNIDDGSIKEQKQIIETKWKALEAAIVRRIDLTPNLIDFVKKSNINEAELFGQIAEARASLLNLINEKSKVSDGGTQRQKEAILKANETFGTALNRLAALRENYPQLRQTDVFKFLLEELNGTNNRINTNRIDYDNSIANSKPRRLTKTQSAEFSARFLDNRRILFSQSGNFFVTDAESFSLVQISKEANPQTFVSVFNATPTEDRNLIAYVVSDASKYKTLFVPNYLDEFVQAPTTRRGFSEQKILVVKSDGSLSNAFETKLPKAEGASFIRSLRWAADNSSLVVDRVDKDTKRRQLFYIHDVGSKAEQTILVTEETDEKWIAPLSSIVETNPKNDAQILFGSERDGFNHLYLATLERAAKQPNPTGEIRQENPTDAGFTGKVDVKQLTKGNWQVEWAKWRSAPEGVIIYSSTQDDAAIREFFTLNSDGKSGRYFQTAEKGMKTSPQLSKTNDVLLYSFSQWNKPVELFAFQTCNNCNELVSLQQLTKSIPERFKQIKWNEPKFIDILSRDGKRIKSKIYLPANFDKTKKYPMVIFVHGAGYLQNTINGWNNYYREFMFNELLTQKGYVVLDIDYRGSAGYGRDWRTDVYDFLGGKDYEDHLDAIDFMVKNYAVDQNKIGVYGGSYGGFMAEMLVMRAPEKIAAAAALRPVADWKNYFYSSPNYTVERLGFPDKNAEAYKRSSPISYADKLQKPLLILHGLVDDNVPAQDSMQLVEKLMRLEKTRYFEAMFYPSENHGFTRPSSWTDEYERILMFFEKHLK